MSTTLSFFVLAPALLTNTSTVPNFSLDDRNGLDYVECSEILKYLGCDDAMQFDGGHSTGMIFNGKHVDKPTLQRKVPTAIGFVCE